MAPRCTDEQSSADDCQNKTKQDDRVSHDGSPFRWCWTCWADYRPAASTSKLNSGLVDINGKACRAAPCRFLRQCVDGSSPFYNHEHFQQFGNPTSRRCVDGSSPFYNRK